MVEPVENWQLAGEGISAACRRGGAAAEEGCQRIPLARLRQFVHRPSERKSLARSPIGGCPASYYKTPDHGKEILNWTEDTII